MLLELGNAPEAALNATTAMEIDASESVTDSPSWWRICLWLGLSASGSVMLLATTNQLCIDVATVPFLWILPLSLYLITFILCFDNPRWYDRRVSGLLLSVAAPAACWALRKEADVAILDQTVIYSLVLFACCMACHGELVRSRPTPKYLTLFFLLVSAGGALGGLFVAMIAPPFFQGYWEYHIGLAVCVLMTLLAWYSEKIWLGTPVPNFWLWIIAVTTQVGSIGYFMYEPLSATLVAHDRSVMFGVYAISVILGVVLTVALERKPKLLRLIWIAITVLQLLWIVCYCQTYLAEQMNLRMYIGTGLGLALSTLLCVIADALLSNRNAPTQQTSIRVLLMLTVAACLASFWYFKSFERWYIAVVAGAVLVGALLEWVSVKQRGPMGQSGGVWFWIPTAVLLVLLCTQWLDVIKQDNQNVTLASRNFYGVLKVRFKEVSDHKHPKFVGKYALSHGQIVHGFQFTDDYWRHQPTP